MMKVKANKKAITEAMISKGWSDAVCCNEAKITCVTFRNVLDGKPCRTSTLGAIAKALEIPASEIIAE